MSNEKVASHEDNLFELRRRLEDLDDFIKGVKDPAFGHVKLRMSRHLVQDIAWVSVLTGNKEDDTTTESGENPLLANNGEKIHKIMGREVGGKRKIVTQKTITPKRNEKEKFGNDVNALKAAFISLKDKYIIEEILSKPQGDTLVRGVAKLAGIKTWENCEIDVTLFADIRDLLKQEALLKKTNNSLTAEFEEETNDDLDESQDDNDLDDSEKEENTDNESDRPKL